MRRFEGRVAAITGGLGDIGREIARALAREGAHVAIADVRDDDGGLVAELSTEGVRARYDRVDVTDAAAVAGWFKALENDFDVATLVVPNAAVVEPAAWDAITHEAWCRQIDVNLTGAFLTAREGAARMRAAEQTGAILFVGSWAADRPDAAIIPYCASKAGLRMVMRCLAKELAPHGILVNELAPGYVDAGLSAQIFRDRPGSREACEARVPVGRLIAAEEVAAAALALLDPANRHATGSVVTMDGGLSL